MTNTTKIVFIGATSMSFGCYCATSSDELRGSTRRWSAAMRIAQQMTELARLLNAKSGAD